MNIQKLHEAEKRFFEIYPGGFNHPEMKKIGLKHKPEKMTALAQESFAKDKFKDPLTIALSMAQIVSRSSMISIFEKPKFKDFIQTLGINETKHLAQGLWEFLYNNQEQGFNMMLEILETGKLAKWSLITACPLYFKPTEEVFIKPTTAKGIIEYFEINNLHYQAKPTFTFYKAYREIINQMKTKVDKSLAIGNAEFCGFLMMAMNNFTM